MEESSFIHLPAWSMEIKISSRQEVNEHGGELGDTRGPTISLISTLSSQTRRLEAHIPGIILTATFSLAQKPTSEVSTGR